jgi:myosin heavy subunit
MNTLQFTQDEQWAIFKIIAGILHLGSYCFLFDVCRL